MPSGHIPLDALHHPSLFNSHDCLINIPAEPQDEMQRLMSDEISPREMHLSWYSPKFDPEALKAYEVLCYELSHVYTVAQKTVPMF
jgi:hypothetical protein